MPEDMSDFYNLATTENTYFISAEGLNKKSVQKDLFDQMKTVINKHDYQEYYVLSQGEIGRSLLKPTVQMSAWVKFFKTEEEYEKFKENYNPFEM